MSLRRSVAAPCQAVHRCLSITMRTPTWGEACLRQPFEVELGEVVVRRNDGRIARFPRQFHFLFSSALPIIAVRLGRDHAPPPDRQYAMAAYFPRNGTGAPAVTYSFAVALPTRPAGRPFGHGPTPAGRARTPTSAMAFDSSSILSLSRPTGRTTGHACITQIV